MNSPERVDSDRTTPYDPLVDVRLKLPGSLVAGLDEWAVRRKVSRNTIIRMILAANIEEHRT